MKSHFKSLLALLAAAAMATPLAASESKPAAKADLVKGEAIATQVCSACHTADGSRG